MPAFAHICEHKYVPKIRCLVFRKPYHASIYRGTLVKALEPTNFFMCCAQD